MCLESKTGDGAAATFGAAEWLSLAAAPMFALMALLAGVVDNAPGAHEAGAHGSHGAVDGMTVMYLLMSVFHATPWLRLCSQRGRVGPRKVRTGRRGEVTD